jgi:hypothetical protein
MADDADKDVLFARLDRLVAASRTVKPGNRRLVLALEADLRAIRTALDARRDGLAQKLKTAGARSMAVSAYSRIAFLGRGTTPGPTNKQITE